MKCFSLLLLLIATTSCVSLPPGASHPITSAELERLKIGVTKKNDLIALFGLPKSQISNSNELILTYVGDSLSGQRLTAEFAQGTNVLRSILWVPNGTEPESHLDFLLKRYPKLSLDTKSNDSDNPHDLGRTSVYRDEIAKQVVLFDVRRSRVEAIGWYDCDVREPATNSKNSTRKFDIGKK